jgi:hypothetical protein
MHPETHPRKGSKIVARNRVDYGDTQEYRREAASSVLGGVGMAILIAVLSVFAQWCLIWGVL